ncbi:FG-GAP repeat protein [Actinomadura barringtoniae]|uniref:FG-GAP repeat protein n=1 Tax=Actinomadura barringtoniae TaxID=1427535 RepID=A0A939P6L4_9ACTN|nr:FG-GAP-like repeat-containing protein [Actinomadura barringtoniae]MBO2446235.1 FG-GAP repeat protein [Actinomadura barringtoniae]
MNKHMATTTAGAAAAVVALGGVAVLTVQQNSAAQHVAQAAATKRKPARPGDFNGDGRVDLAIAAPEATVAGKGDAGLVSVVYGSPAGADPARHQLITQDSPGVPGDARYQAEFGASLAGADFDRDGYADLAVGTGRAARSIVIVYGGPRGLTSRTVTLTPQGLRYRVLKLQAGDFDGKDGPDLVASQGGSFWTFANVHAKAVPGVRTVVQKDVDEENGAVANIVAADYNGDHRTDLVVTTGIHNEGSISKARAELRLGTPTGLGAPKVFARGWTSEGSGFGVGNGAAAGDVNGDGRADLVVNRVTGDTRTVGLGVFFGTGTGLGKPQNAVRRTPETATVAVGDANGDRMADVALGDDHAAVSRHPMAGKVTVLNGSRRGLVAKGAKVLTQDSRGVPGNAENYDAFGSALSFYDANGDGKADLTVGVRGENETDGWIYAFPGSRAGITVRGVRNFGPRSLGIAKLSPVIGGYLLP